MIGDRGRQSLESDIARHGSRLIADLRQPCTTMAPRTSQLHCGCNVLQVLCQITFSGVHW